MPEQDRWQLELSEYIRQGEPERVEKSAAWQTAIGLQAVDGLKTSSYLLETAKEHIEGNIDIAGAQRRIQSYYKEQKNRQAVEAGTMEADIVSARITELLGEKTFQFSPAELQSIHRRLFNGVFDHAGQFRTYNITRKSSSPMTRFPFPTRSNTWRNMRRGFGRSTPSARATHALLRFSS